MSTTTVPSPVRYTQVGDGAIRNSEGRALIPGTTTHVLVEKLMESARIHARATGSVGGTWVETVHGVVVEAKWMREDEPEADDEPERDESFSLDAVVDALHARGIRAYVEQTGGGCATIYAGGQHVVLDGSETDTRWDVAAGPGTYSWRTDVDSTASLYEFHVGPNDDDGNEAVSLPDTILTAAQAVAWSADAIERTVRDVATRTFARWNQRPCRYCKATVVPGPHGTWVDATQGACPDAPDVPEHAVY